MKKSKKFKGMTLLEIIIALFVFGAVAMILVQATVSIFVNVRASNDVLDKVIDEAPTAENRIKNSTTELPVTIAMNIGIETGDSQVTLAMNVKQYEVINPAVTTVATSSEAVTTTTPPANTEATKGKFVNGDFKFFEYVPGATVTTTTTSTSENAVTTP